MKKLAWYYDFVSPFTYLQSEMLDRFADKAEITYVPVLFAGLLNHWGTTGPAELETKRIWTYRYCKWFGDTHGIPFRMPPGHPFNPIRPLRLGIALANEPRAIQTIFRFIWAEGRDPNDEFAALAEMLGVDDAEARVADEAVKAELRTNTEDAVGKGVFGVPTIEIDGQLFWGADGTDFALAYLEEPGMLDAPEMKRIDTLPAAASRR